MPTERWQEVERIFAETREQPIALRADFLASACGSDAGLRKEVDSLLLAAQTTNDFLAAPALDLLARQISREGWSVKPGDSIGSYLVERRLGAGGMGEVWRARDQRFGRDVAIKLLFPRSADAKARVRALRLEARAAGSLNHTNVLTVHDVGDHGGAPYLVTECLEGESLRARLGKGALPVDEALDVALQVARGLSAAHGRGIVHRDLKPENIFLARDGRAKILDFGLAILQDDSAAGGELAGERASLLTGTAGYMAPEQARGEEVDPRADIFALGAVLYEMLTGARAFRGDGTVGILQAVSTLEPTPIPEVRPEASSLWPIVARSLEKSPADRFASVAEVEAALEALLRERQRPPPRSLFALLRRPAVMAPALLVLAAIAVLGWRWHAASSRARWARSTAAPEIERLFGHGDRVEAFLLAREALDVLPDDPQLRQLWLDVSLRVNIRTEPAGAEVAIAPYRTPGKRWFSLGRTPLERVPIPRGFSRLRVTKEGFEPIEGTGAPGALQRYRLDPLGTLPEGMVRVVASRGPESGTAEGVEDFFFDRFEVTNRQFKRFVDAGGYRKRDHWREEFKDGARSLTWEEAMGRFRDKTGHPGPATWTDGTFPEGEADFPVGGVSFYEAAAYADFAGKSLPTSHHWYRAAGLGRFADILTVSNFSGAGPAAVGSHEGLGPFGTYDMAGNVKEWCWNETDGGRALLGGAWNETGYMFADYDAKPPFERAPTYGFRLAKYLRPLSPALLARLPDETLGRDVRKARPVGDEIFAVYRRQYAYDHTPLDAVVESTNETDLWVRHTVAVDAAYGGERLRLHLFLPKNAAPPYQTVAFFPPADAFLLRSSRDMSMSWVNFVLRSGRAFLYPVYKGTYERWAPAGDGSAAARELLVQWSRDLGRSLDYLETRPDIDRERVSFFGVSAGAEAGLILTAVEPRFKTVILQGTGVPDDVPPEIDVVNYAPRIRVPTLVLNGRYDFATPVETMQRPLFDLLGAAPADKRQAVLESGHAVNLEEVVREVLPWLDRYLGPVTLDTR